MPRCEWTHDLHDYFVSAVEELGGEKIATPLRILERIDGEGLTPAHVKSHLQMYRKKREEERVKEESLIGQMIMRQTQLHLRQYKRLQNMVNHSIRNPQRQEEEMHKSIVEVGEASNSTKEVSCKSLYQSSRIGLNESGKDEENIDNNNDENLSLELTLSCKD